MARDALSSYVFVMAGDFLVYESGYDAKMPVFLESVFGSPQALGQDDAIQLKCSPAWPYRLSTAEQLAL